jgi:site-specific DNA-methyltransferase (adenine-specific)
MLGDCLERMKEIPDASVDLVVTSPPYDNLRDYNGYSFEFEKIAMELTRVIKDGGVIVWVVGDATIKGSESGTSFRQSLYFKDVCRLNLHDTMIWNKGEFSAVGALKTRYAPVFEYMFIFTKGKLATFNPIKDKPNKGAGRIISGNIRQADGTTKRMSSSGSVISEFGQRFNIWEMPGVKSRKDTRHPAPFPIALATDHILSWSNPGDIVLDPFLGSGTTGVAALDLDRRFIGIEISEEYFQIAQSRLQTIIDEKSQLLFSDVPLPLG